jgi:UDP-N-acetylglucosamine:LPS N-acetylglucosamine transferase
MDGLNATSNTIWARSFLPPSHATRIADLVVCTGGVGTCYTNLSFGVPSLVVPMQPEQASNGIALERHGAGRVLTKNLIFVGSSSQYEQAFNPDLFAALLAEMKDSLDMHTEKCRSLQKAFSRYNPQKTLCSVVESLA